MDQTQTAATKTPEQTMQAKLEETMVQAPTNVVETKQAEGAKMESPEDREKKKERSKEIQTAIAGLEARMRERERKAQEDEASATKVQEAIYSKLGQGGPFDILSVVRKENFDMVATIQRQEDALKQEHETIEKQLGSMSSAPETQQPTGPEEKVEETSKDLAPDKTAEAAASATPAD